MRDDRTMRNAQDKIDTLMKRAREHSTGIAESVLREAMLKFARKLRPSHKLQYLAGMGTRCIRIHRGGTLPDLWVTLDDVYYYGYADTKVYRQTGPRTTRFVRPLTDLLIFLNDVDNDHHVFTRDMTVAGTKSR